MILEDVLFFGMSVRGCSDLTQIVPLSPARLHTRLLFVIMIYGLYRWCMYKRVSKRGRAEGTHETFFVSSHPLASLLASSQSATGHHRADHLASAPHACLFVFSVF